MIRLLVVDDHPVVREGLVAVLNDRPDLEVVGTAGSGEEAIASARCFAPDVILLDLEMPGMAGVAAIPALREAAPEGRILVFTAYSTDECVFGALRSGASGYLLKGAAAEEIARAVRTVHGGGSHLEAGVAEKLLASVRGPQGAAPVLSKREREVLKLVAGGQPNKQIARALGITERTVKFHLTALFQKLGAENRAGAVAIAAQRGLL